MQQCVSAVQHYAKVIGLCLVLGFSTSNLLANEPDLPQLTTSVDDSQIIREILQFIQHHHYQKRLLDDNFAADVYQQYLDLIDPQRMYLSRQDIQAFEHLATQLDEQLAQGQLQALTELFNLMQKRRWQAVNYNLQWLQDEQQTFVYQRQESLPIYANRFPRQADLAGLEDLWRKLLKNQFINGLLEDETEAQIRIRLNKRYNNQIKRLLQVDERDMFSSIANSLTMVTDPHSAYLSPRRVEDFNIDMSLSLEGIGAVLQRDNDYTKVVRIVVGGPADKAGELKAADYIVGIAQQDEEFVDVVGWRLDDVVNLIRGPKDSQVSLQILPAGDLQARPRTIHIIRNKVQLEDQAATQEIITLETDMGPQKIGVIKLPTFYFDYEGYRRGDENYRSTSHDVFNLVAELRAAEVDGIIIDLRNNGGGSLIEANQLTGLFIEQGPTVQVRYNNGHIEKQQDRNPLLVYAGPMAVLVNRVSASASEIFAGAMQDYQRALIVGSQTYGKGTVQTLTDLSQGQIKYTQAKFYRVSGASTQHKGVIPDIDLPMLIDHSLVGESNLDYALPWDQVSPLQHPRYINLPQIIPYLQEQQKQRNQEDANLFYAQQVKAYREQQEDTISLHLETRRAEWEARKLWYLQAINELREKSDQAPVAKVEEHEFDYASAEQDPYIQASAQVLVDWLRLSE
ncbi:MAG: carboxy terminal-processing peptidase [Gammaproteobacteria bacterium]|nr:carboxy terminal-processing peptidase [Gammaproteobacteria bacterium]